MRRGIFVTGTDTGVGKTYAACLLGRRLRQAGMAVRPFKPVESGCLPGPDGKPFPADAAALRDAMLPTLPLSAVCFYPLAAALSPHLAARLEGKAIDLNWMRRTIVENAGAFDLLLVEGAGGIAVEIQEGYSFARLAHDLSFSALVVAENRLGVLNHLQLTIRYLADEGVPLLGVILNDRTPSPFPVRESNEAEVRRICGHGYLGRINQGASYLPEEVFGNLRGGVF
jgi:dethiobiotin synthetase